MFKNVFFALIASVIFVGNAQATTIDITLTANQPYQYSTGGALAPNIKLPDTSDLTLSNGAGIEKHGHSLSSLLKNPSISL